MNSIITFYSFKGGVGRSMALANIGYLLAQKGKSVLAVDWDLEAPGLDKYFSGCPGASIQDSSRGGLIDLLTDAYQGNKPDWHDYTSRVSIEEHTIQLITSGRRDENYPAKVLGFNWHSFFEEAEGGAFIESLRDAWHEEFEMSLIDSRTGYTDSSGICTIQLPDILVPVFTTTEESAKGAIEVVERAQRGRQKLAYDRSRLLVFPLPSRYDGRTQYQEAKKWLNDFAQWFGPCYSDWLPTGITALQVIERTKLPYIGYFSFGTQMPAAIEGTSDPESLGYAYNVAATIIADEFQQVERLMSPAVDVSNEPTRAELALLRMRRALQEGKFEWRSIDALATAAGIGVTEALDILRGESDAVFSRGKSGRIIVRLRNISPFMNQRDEARVRFDQTNPLRDKECVGYIELSCFPERFEASRFDLQHLRAATERGGVDVGITGLPFLVLSPDTYPIQDGLENMVTDDFWRLQQSGYFYHRTVMRPNSIESGHGVQCAMEFRRIAVHVALAIHCIIRLYDGLLAVDAEVTFALTLIGTENRRLVSLDVPLPADYICRIPQIIVERKRSIASWRSELVDHALEIAKEIYLRFNWFQPNLEAARAAILENVVAKLKP